MSQTTPDDVKASLNLPTTDFPMRGQLPVQEPKRLTTWQKEDLYGQLRDHRKGKPLFVLHDGPPYANGPIHMGHALNKVLKDIIVRSKTLSGYDAPMVPGWDCHGLPIELAAEKKLKKRSHQMDPKAFREACRQHAFKHMEAQKAAFMRLGVLADWQHPYVTMSPEYEAELLATFATMYRKGCVIRGHKPVFWCFSCGSALADAEVAYQDKTSQALYVGFASTDPQALWALWKQEQRSDPIDLLIWTTTGWTLESNQAVCVHQDAAYVLFSAQGRYGPLHAIVAQERLASVVQALGLSEVHEQGTCSGAALQNHMLKHPFHDREVPVWHADHVTLDAGTGCVHTAPDHGVDDFNIGRDHGASLLSRVNAQGRYTEEATFAGEPVFDIGDRLEHLLVTHQRLHAATPLTHSYPHCWRHKTPLVYRATPQWYVDVARLKQDALQKVAEVQWLPEWGKKRMHNTLEQHPGWCVSRQRVWGVPIPLVLHETTGHVHPNMEAVWSALQQEAVTQGIEAWHALDLTTILGEDAEGYQKCMDVLDVWFDSGASFACVLGQRPGLRVPSDVVFEGTDQHRGWFQSSLLTSMATRGEAPYRCVLTHGYVVDDHGHKMSKSMGNVIDPNSVVQQYGADVLRWWVASSDYRSDAGVSDEILKRSADAYRRMRNTLRFLLANTCDFDPTRDGIPLSECVALDAWVVRQAQELQAQVCHAYDTYQFHQACQAIMHFCTVTLGGFYLDVIKDRQYTVLKTAKARRSAQTALQHVLEHLVRLLAPVLCFTTEEVWSMMAARPTTSVHLSTWYHSPEDTPQVDDAVWKQLLMLRLEANKLLEAARKAGTLGGSLEASLHLYLSASQRQQLAPLADELHFVFLTSQVHLHALSETDVDAQKTGIEDVCMAVRLAPGAKCVRCWHRRDDLNESGVCRRCQSNMPGGHGETRHHA